MNLHFQKRRVATASAVLVLGCVTANAATEQLVRSQNIAGLLGDLNGDVGGGILGHGFRISKGAKNARNR